MGKIRQIATDKAWEMHDKLQCEAQARFINYVMEEEDVDYQTAVAICYGNTIPKEPEYTLGYKLADPMMMMAITQPGKKARTQAVADIEANLDPEELEIFRRDVLTFSTRKKFKAALKRKRKNQEA